MLPVAVRSMFASGWFRLRRTETSRPAVGRPPQAGAKALRFGGGGLNRRRGYDEPFAFFRILSSTLQEFDANGAVDFSVGQYPRRHHNIGPLMGFIDHNIFDIWGFHLRVPLGLEIEKPANPSSSETRREKEPGALANLRLQFRLNVK